MKYYKSRENGRKTKAYTTWHNMVARCGAQPPYLDCTVTTEWLDFQEFAAWYYAQPNADKSGYTLDKDVLVKGNKVYGPETCCIIPDIINRLVSSGNTGKGKPKALNGHVSTSKDTEVLPFGVISTPQGYRSRLRYKGKDTLGEATGCPQVAHQDYRIAKTFLIHQVAHEYAEYLEADVLRVLSTWCL